MEKIILGEKNNNLKYDFRETCFGIVYKNNEFYLTEKHNELSLIGGGVEEGESHQETLKREFIEESGLTIIECFNFVTIDCFWYTKDKRNIESLASFYIVKVSDEVIEPTEKESKLIKVSREEIIYKLPLPYQKKAIELYLEKEIETGD